MRKKISIRALLSSSMLATIMFSHKLVLAVTCDRGFVPSNGQCIPGVTNGGILPGPSSGRSARSYLLDTFLPELTNSFLIFTLIVGVAVLVIGGLMWLFASNSEELKNRAREAIIWSFVGVAIAILSYLMVQLLVSINFFA